LSTIVEQGPWQWIGALASLALAIMAIYTVRANYTRYRLEQIQRTAKELLDGRLGGIVEHLSGIDSRIGSLESNVDRRLSRIEDHTDTILQRLLRNSQ
jgi:hypothetical protein